MTEEGFAPEQDDTVPTAGCVEVVISQDSLSPNEVEDDFLYFAAPIADDQPRREYDEHLTVTADVLARWQHAEHDLRHALQPLVEAHAAWAAAQAAWAAAVQQYKKVAEAEIEQHIADAQRADEEQRDAEQEAEDARRAAEEAALDAQFGPREFLVVRRFEKVGHSRHDYVFTLHRQGCRRSDGYVYGAESLRRDEAVAALRENNARVCGTCRVDHYLRKVSPDAIALLDARKEQDRHAARPMQRKKVELLLGSVEKRLWISSSGGGRDGWKTEQMHTYLRVTWNDTGYGPTDMPEARMRAFTQVLLGGGYHVTPVEAERDWQGKRRFRELRVARMTLAEETLAQTAGTTLLMDALFAGMTSTEALESMRAGTLTPASIAAFTALRGDV